MIGIELLYWRCKDGTQVVNRDDGPWLEWSSKDQEPYERKLFDLKETMSERLLACKTNDDFIEFTSDFGMPGAADTQESLQEVSLKSIRKSRDNLQALFDSVAKGDMKDSVRRYNSIAKTVRPILSLPRAAKTPILAFIVDNPFGMMRMEAALAVANATVLLTCNNCSRPFLAGALTSKRTNAYYCSNKCRVAAQRAEAK